MKKIAAVFFVGILLTLQASVHAEGLLYRLPKDGAWAEYKIESKETNPDGSEVTLTGTLKLSSVGTAQVDGKACRWIELETNAKRNKEEFTTIDKLLIPEEQLTVGKDPLKHILKAWCQHSQIPGGPRLIDSQGQEMKHVKPLVHGPYKNAQKLESKLLDNKKLGKLECEGVSATEKMGGLNISYDIRLNEKSPFGVVTLRYKLETMQGGQTSGMETNLTLSDFGTDAKSALPKSK